MKPVYKAGKESSYISSVKSYVKDVRLLVTQYNSIAKLYSVETVNIPK